MNGIVSASTSRSSISSRQITTAIAAGACLFSGFVLGMQMPASKLFSSLSDSLSKVITQPVHLFETQTVDYSKITWIEKEVNEKTELHSAVNSAKTNDEMLNVKVEFVPFTLNPEQARHLSKKIIYASKKQSFAPARARTAAKKKISNIEALQVAVNNLAEAANLFDDYQRAAQEIRTDFKVAMLSPEEVRQQLAKYEQQQLLKSEPVGVVEEAIQQGEHQRERQLASNKKSEPNPNKNKKNGKKLNRVNSAIGFTLPKKKRAEPASEPVPVAEVAAEVTEVQSVAAVVQTAVQSEQSENLNTQTVNTHDSDSIKTSLSSADQILEPSEPTETHFSDVLTPAEKMELTKALLQSQLAAHPVNQVVKQQQVARAQQNIHQNRPRIPQPEAPGESEQQNADLAESMALASAEVPSDNNQGHACEVLSNQKFLIPTNSGLNDGQSNQICPQHKEWISRDWNGRGWVKLQGADHIDVIQYYPAPQGGATVLLNQNAIALLAVTSGIHIVKGAGIILGVAPEGYKVEFSGRAEETQYFETNGKRYFAILNAEPGITSVVKLLSEKNQTLSTTVFTPVVEDVITYLDLSAPVSIDLSIQVVKNGARENKADEEVVGLEVALATQSEIQGITSSSGRVTIRDVKVVRGFPLFIDVSSKTNQQRSYTYRYELNRAPKNGVYVVNQIAEHSLYKWLRQVRHRLSSQSAMIVGFFNRKKLNGFKNHYYVRTVVQGEKFGMEPLNYSILWDGKISEQEPLEGDLPRFMTVQVPEGLSQVRLINETNQTVSSRLIPISPRVIHVVSE